MPDLVGTTAMLTFLWNALRRGDEVLVHDTAEHGFALMRGEVAIVDTVAGGPNDLGVRIAPGARVSRPERLSVHLGPLDPNEECWRCDIAVAARHGGAPGASG